MHAGAEKIRTAVELLRRAQFSEAEPIFRQILDVEPGQPDALHGLSVIAHGRGDKDGAESLLRALVAARPERASAKYDLACMLIDRGGDDEALLLLQDVLRVSQQHAQAYFQLGFIHRLQGSLDEAETALRQCLLLTPHHAGAVCELARVYRDRGEYASALGIFEEAAATSGADARLFHAWWQFLSMSALATYGPDAIRRGVALYPGDADLRMDLAQTLEELGDPEAAQSEYRAALRLDRNRGAAIGNLIALLGQDAELSLMAIAEAILSDARARAAAKAVVGYGLGKAHHARKEYEAAFRAWSVANASRAQEAGKLDRKALVAQVEQTCSTFSAEEIGRLAQWGSQDSRPILIVGMPRSGTTLVEQILSAHPQVGGLGELPDLPIVAERFCRQHGLKGAWPALADICSGASISEAAEHYRRVLQFRAAAAETRLIDKSPLNFFNVGLFTVIFPLGRVIWCRRDPRDVCLSIYAENFAPSQKYATDLDDLAFYYRQHEALMQHWGQVVGDRLLEVSYETLVGAQEAESRRLVSFAGLEWDSRCLEFHLNERAVQTPSKWQVRQPMYTSALARWRRYEPWIAPLLKAFGAEDRPQTA